MSARNYLSAREKSLNKVIDCLPNINNQRFSYRHGNELPGLSANRINRNVGYSFEVQPYRLESGGRASTPYSDFFSESETGTPDFHSEESDSSAGSALRQNTAEATNILSEEWERIERTVYDEEGEKTSRSLMKQECEQWRSLHPQLRIVGKAIQLPEKRISYRQLEHEEIIAMHYSDYEEFSDIEDRVSESSTDVTPQNSPRVSICEDEPKITREKISFYPMFEEHELPDNFSSLLHITPIQIRSPPKKRLNSSILKSEIASSRWMRSNRPDSSVNPDRNSAKSFMSLDTRNYGMALSASERNKLINNRVLTARQRDFTKLEPLYTPESDINRFPANSFHSFGYRKVSLPPLLMEEERKKMPSLNSAKKYTKTRKSGPRSLFHLDKAKH